MTTLCHFYSRRFLLSISCFVFILCVGRAGMLDNVDEDVSFSDLEDDENETEHAKVFHLNKNDTSILFSKTCMVCHDQLQVCTVSWSI